MEWTRACQDKNALVVGVHPPVGTREGRRRRSWHCPVVHDETSSLHGPVDHKGGHNTDVQADGEPGKVLQNMLLDWSEVYLVQYAPSGHGIMHVNAGGQK